MATILLAEDNEAVRLLTQAKLRHQFTVVTAANGREALDILGIIISILGISNMKGNISSLHWYHRQRVSPDDVMPFGKRVGLGTLIIGIAIIVFGLFSLITYLTEIEVYTIIGAALLIPAVIVGLGLSLYAIIKYNKGLF